MTSKDSIKLGVAGVLTVTAVIVFFVLRQTKTELPNTEDAKSLWLCLSCGKDFELTPAEVEAKVRLQVEEAPSGGDSAEPQARGRNSQRTFKAAFCDTCQKWSAVAAKRCPKCQTVFSSATKNGQVAICPKCHWDPTTGQDAEGERLNAVDSGS